MSLQAGDVGFTHQDDFGSWWIRWAERRKYGKDSHEAKYNHAYLVIDPDGTLIQATPAGITVGHESDYAGVEHELRRPPYASVANAEQACLAIQELLGERYGWLTVVCEALAFMTGTRLRFGIDGKDICSGAVSYAATRGGIDVRAPLHPTSAGAVAGALSKGGIELGDDVNWNSPADVMYCAIQQRWPVVSA